MTPEVLSLDSVLLGDAHLTRERGYYYATLRSAHSRFATLSRVRKISCRLGSKNYRRPTIVTASLRSWYSQSVERAKDTALWNVSSRPNSPNSPRHKESAVYTQS